MTTIGLAAVLAAGLPGCETSKPYAPSPGEQAIEAKPPSDAQLQRLAAAEAAKEAGEFDQALVLFQDLLADNPTITTAYLGIGDIYMVKRDYAHAEPAYRRAARIEPRSFAAQFGHGLALQMLQRFVDAVRAYQRALSIEPDSDKANLNLATTYLQMAQPHQALAYAERAVELNPGSGPAHANLGSIYDTLGRYGEASDQYVAALELMGNDPRLMMNLINVQAKEERYREAAITADTLVRIQPTAQAYERLGWCYFKLRQYDDSIEAYRRAVEIDADHWPAYNGIGVNALNTWLLSKKQDVDAMREAGRAFRLSLRVNAEQQRVIALLLNYSL